MKAFCFFVACWTTNNNEILNKIILSPFSRLGKDTAAPATDKPKADIDPGLIHKALFKTATKGDPPARPVSFTVKIWVLLSAF